MMAERVIWEREIDTDKIAERQKKFVRRFAVVAIVIAVVIIGLSSGSNWLLAVILIAIIGLVWGGTVRAQGLSDRANPYLVVDGGILRLGRHEIYIEDVRRYTTLASEIQTSVLGKYSRIAVGKAIFRFDDPGTRSEPNLVEFGWPNMKADGVATVQEALEGVFDDLWVEPAELVDRSEIPKRRRPRML